MGVRVPLVATVSICCVMVSGCSGTGEGAGDAGTSQMTTSSGETTAPTTGTSTSTSMSTSVSGSTAPTTTVASDSSSATGSTGATKFDLTEPDLQIEVKDWLLTFSAEPNAGFVEWKMFHVDTETGMGVEICEVAGSAGIIKANSATFTRDDRLIVSNSLAWIYEVSLPDCVLTELVPIPDAMQGMAGIAPDEGFNVYAASASANDIIHVDLDTGILTPLQVDLGPIGYHGLTWDDDEKVLYFLNGPSNIIYRVDPQTNEVSQLNMPSMPFGGVGFEWHPHNASLYGCTDSGDLWQIDLDGTVTVVGGPVGVPDTGCNNLGAPWGEPPLPG